MYRPGISVLKEAALAGAECDQIHAMHDPTEGGLASALHEVAWAAGVGIRIHADGLPVFPETQAICNHYHLDPLGLIASGALLIIVPAQEAAKLVTCLRSHRIRATNIGEVTDRRHGVKLATADGDIDLPLYEQDELTKI
jgi:hydrogenase maturation factor